MKIKVPFELRLETYEYLEDRGYKVISARPKKDQLVITAKKADSAFFLEEAREMTTMIRTSRENLRRSY